VYRFQLVRSLLYGVEESGRRAGSILYGWIEGPAESPVFPAEFAAGKNPETQILHAFKTQAPLRFFLSRTTAKSRKLAPQ
jgi:hypothetical protein